MPTLTAPARLALPLWQLFADRPAKPAPSCARDPAPADRGRAAFVQDMIARNALAFQSEEDVQAMLHLFPGRF